MAKYLEVMNSITGEKAYIDVRRSRYERLARGFMNHLRLKGGFLKHIILTQDEEHYRPRILNSFFMALKKNFGKVHYIWTVEVQEERLERYGKAVLHWHILIAFPPGTWFDKEGNDVKKIQSYWHYGDNRNSVEVRSVRRPSVNYLMKYVGKALSSSLAEKVRRIGSSSIPGYLRQSWTKLQRVIGDLVCGGWCSLDELRGFDWSRNGSAFLVFFDEIGRKCRHKIYDAGSSPWFVTQRYEEDAF